jgi:hypothetical protein
MTAKERLQRACKGEEIDRVPWAPMIYQWYHVNKYNRTLPPELLGCDSALDALRAMKAECFAKHEGFVVYASSTKYRAEYEYAGKCLKQPVVKTCLHDVFGREGNLNFRGSSQRQDRITTPKGELTAVWRYEEETGAPFEEKFFWTDFHSEYERIRSLLEDVEFIVDADRWQNVITDLGEDGIAHLRIPPSPLKILHWLTGIERTVYFTSDHPTEIAELVRIYEHKRLELVKQAVKLPRTLVFTSGDNMDTITYTPSLFEKFIGRSFAQIADIIHEEGKLLFSHACGRLSEILKLLQDAGVDGLEGMAPPPVGDIGFGEARKQLGDRFVLQGGMTHLEEKYSGPETSKHIFRGVAELFSELPHRRAFIYGSGCCLDPGASYENILALRDACRLYGVVE